MELTLTEIHTFETFKKSELASILPLELIIEIGIYFFNYDILLYGNYSKISKLEFESVLPFITSLKIKPYHPQSEKKITLEDKTDKRIHQITDLNPNLCLHLKKLKLTRPLSKPQPDVCEYFIREYKFKYPDINISKVFIPSLKNLFNLTNLKIEDVVYDNEICGLTNLKSLIILSDQNNIFDKSLYNLTSLTKLNLRMNNNITDYSLSRLVKLRILIYDSSFGITDKTLMSLTNLTTLSLWWTAGFTDDGLSNLTNLTDLNIGENQDFTNRALINLTNLKKIDVSDTSKITDHGITHLINLTNIFISDSSITKEGIKPLTNLVNWSKLMNRY